jgi:integrase
MSRNNSTPPAHADKPADNREAGCQAKPSKPYPEFPLTAHPTGRWCKKIRGKLHYFGPIADPDAALAKYVEQKEDLHAGRTPRPDPDALTIKDLCNHFLAAKQSLVESGELARLTWTDYYTACHECLTAFGTSRLLSDLGPDDFAKLRKRLAAKWGPQRLNKNVQFVRCLFKYAFDERLIPLPVHFGQSFKRPSKRVLRLHRAKQGPKLFTPEEVRRVLGAAYPQVRAMVLLGINCGFGNADCGVLPLSALDLDGGWANFPRPKTGIDRRCWLWPETVDAIREALAVRPDAKKPEHAGLVFITRLGDSWHTGTNDGPLSREFSKLLRKLGINGRHGLGFYSLRHTHRTVTDEARDQPAADYIMGHAKDDMASVYRERISEDRLRTVAEHVRRSLYVGPQFDAT